MTLGLNALFTVSVVGFLEIQSMAIIKFCSKWGRQIPYVILRSVLYI